MKCHYAGSGHARVRLGDRRRRRRHGLRFHVRFGRHGVETTLVDYRESDPVDAPGRVESAATFPHDEGSTDATPADILDQTMFTLDIGAAVADADLVSETVPEDFELKRATFETLYAAAPFSRRAPPGSR